MNGATAQLDPNSFQPLNAAPQQPAAQFDDSSFQPLPPTQQKTAIQRASDALTGANETDEQWQSPVLGGMLSGALKAGAGGIGNILDMLSRKPDPRLMVGDQPNEKARQHIQDAAAWLKSGGEPEGFWENVGGIGEQVLEYIGLDGLTKLASAPATATEGMSAAARVTNQLKGTQEVAGVLAKHPKLAGLVAVGLKASKDAITSGAALKDAALMGGQTYVHTEDPEQAALAALMGGAIHVGSAGAQASLAHMAPKILRIGGEEVPALASQVNAAGKTVEGRAVEAPKIEAAQQQAAQNIIRNKARQATAAVLDDINSTRQTYDPARMLAAPGEQQDFTFTREGPPTTEEPTGTLVQRGEAVPKTESHAGAAGVSPQQTEIGSLARTVPSRALERPQAFKTASAAGEELAAGERAQSQIDQDTIERIGIKKAQGKKLTADERSQLAQAQARESTAAATTEPRGERIGGGGQMRTKDPHEATAWLHELEEIQQHPSYAEMPAERQAQIEAQRSNLQQQLGTYYNSPFAQRFQPIDVKAVTDQVNTFGGAAAQIRASVAPVYERLSAASRGTFDTALAEFKDASKALRDAAPGAAQDAAQARYDTASKAVDNLIDLHKGAINAQDYMAAKRAWGKSAKLNELHQVFERMMNDVTAEETGQGYNRVMTGNAKAVQRWLEKGNNMTALDQMIGQDGRHNLKDITRLLTDVHDGRKTVAVANAVRSELGKRIGRVGYGAAVGAGVAHLTGQNVWLGAMAGAAGEDSIRMILRTVAHEPAVGRLFDYAVRNDISPKIYAPLIARMIATPMQSQQGNTP